jgi:hypothetical protein
MPAGLHQYSRCSLPVSGPQYSICGSPLVFTVGSPMTLEWSRNPLWMYPRCGVLWSVKSLGQEAGQAIWDSKNLKGCSWDEVAISPYMGSCGSRVAPGM